MFLHVLEKAKSRILGRKLGGLLTGGRGGGGRSFNGRYSLTDHKKPLTLNELFQKERWENEIYHVKVTRKKEHFTQTCLNGLRDNMYTAGDIFKMLEFLFCIVFVPFGGGGVSFSIGLSEFDGSKLCCITC